MRLLLTLCAVGTSSAATYESTWSNQNDRIWIGSDAWANPMEDWMLQDGRLHCTSKGGNRNVHSLVCQLSEESGTFETSVRAGLLEKGKTGSVGFRVGIHDEINDYRGNCFWGSGIDAGISMDGQMKLADQSKSLDPPSLEDLTLVLNAKPAGDDYDLTLEVKETVSGRVVGSLGAKVAAERLFGNIALVNNLDAKQRNGSRFWFSDWKIRGSKVKLQEDHRFGPILWSMYTLSDSRSPEGYVMKISVQMPPMGEQDSRTVSLQLKKGDAWTSVETSVIDPDARNVAFRIPQWAEDRDMPYRFVYSMRQRNGALEDHYRQGVIRKEPKGRPLVFGSLTCQIHYGFPYDPVARNVAAANPDMLFFSGDQMYELNGHFGIIRTPADRSILNYLRKWYMFGWVFGDVMRDRPTLCTPDDHDVYQGNLWGNGGNAVIMRDHDAGGYAQPEQMINVVHRTHTSHHPKFYDSTPIDRDITVYYGDMVYGRVSFAIISDRMFKSGPKGTVCDWEGRADLLTDKDYDVSKLDKPGLVLLGDRQIRFLEHWAQDWRGADMKVLLSQTVFSQVLTHSGSRQAYYQGDMDSGGWPQSARNRAIRTIRKCFPLHISGDQHLPSLVQYGVDDQRDSNWSFCPPAITVGWQRWWVPDELGWSYENRPAHNIANTGKYTDGVGNKVYVYALGNPQGSKDKNRYKAAHVKSSGFGIVRIDCEQRTYGCESYRFLIDYHDKKSDNQFPGFPHTIHQRENYGRKPYGYLGEYVYEACKRPAVKVYDEANDELVYALRLDTGRFRPWVFKKGVYTVMIGDPDKDQWKVVKGQKPKANHR